MDPGESSPLHYASTSSPPTRSHGRAARLSSVPPRRDGVAHSLDSNLDLFVRSSTHTPARYRRHDLANPPSDTASFSNLDPNTSEADAIAGQSKCIIWGTNISVQDSISSFKDFLLNYRSKYRLICDGTINASEALPNGHIGQRHEYMDLINTMLEFGVTVMNLDLRNLHAYPSTRKLWYQLQDFPNEIIPIMDQALKDIVVELAQKKMDDLRSQSYSCKLNNNAPSSSAPINIPDLVSEVEIKVYKVRPFGCHNIVNIRELDPSSLDKLIAIKGLVIRTTPIIPDMKDALFQCSMCNFTVRVDIDRGKIAEPTICPRAACRSPNSMVIIHNRCGFADKQVLKIQETPDFVPDGQTPHSLSVCVYDELVDVCRAGDRVEITGIFKSSQVRVNPRQRSIKNVFQTYVDALHIQKTDKRRIGIDVSTMDEEISRNWDNEREEVRKLTVEEEERIREVSKRSDLIEILSRSLAPSIFEMDDVKKGILLQLFGGSNKTFEKGCSPKYRGEINVLLCGDPSTSKSQLLRYVHQIAPRGVYTSGKGSSAVGLTAYVTRDMETKELVLESGALVLSDGGVCCIDEFDKMNDSTRSILHEVMEQQTVSIAKAGIITTLNARTSILASANPVGSRYNPNLPVPANIDLPPTLLSRFDLVYLILDRIDEQTDRLLARHLVGMYLEDAPEHASSLEILPLEFLTAYISYARMNFNPKISEEAGKRLVQAYVEMRSLGCDVRIGDERRITATTRQLESMIRLSEAHAKMRLDNTVLVSDVDQAVYLIKSALKQSATDSRTGLIDMSLLTEGLGATDRHRRDVIISSIRTMVNDIDQIKLSDLIKRILDSPSMFAGLPGVVDSQEVTMCLRHLEIEGVIRIFGEGPRSTVRRMNIVPA